MFFLIQVIIWSFAEKDDEKKVSNASSMETAKISSSSKVSCENSKSEKQSKFGSLKKLWVVGKQ